MNSNNFQSPEEQILFIREILIDWAKGELSNASTCFAIHSILTEVDVTDEDVKLAEKIIKDYRDKKKREGEKNLEKLLESHDERKEGKENFFAER